MVSLSLVLTFDEAYILNKVRVFDKATELSYFDDTRSRERMLQISKTYYLPIVEGLITLVKKYPQKFKIQLSLSGLVIEQMIRFSPELLSKVQELASYEEVDFLSQTYYRSLATLFDREELREQLHLQKKLLEKYFAKTPSVFHGTLSLMSFESLSLLKELAYTSFLYRGKGVDTKPFQLVHPSFLGISCHPIANSLSEDLSKRYYDSSWEEYPLRASTYASWLNNFNGNGEEIILELPLSSIKRGVHKDLLSFFDELLEELEVKNYNISFEHLKNLGKEDISIHSFELLNSPESLISDMKFNSLQKDALLQYLKLGEELKEAEDRKLLSQWRSLSSYDYIELMELQNFKKDSSLSSYFDSPYDIYLYFQNSLFHLRSQLSERKLEEKKKEIFSEKVLGENPLDKLKELVYE